MVSDVQERCCNRQEGREVGGLVSGTASLRRQGRLRNGNRPGDSSVVSRCGAKTRKGAPCRGPSMSNGRCRMHGGLSTGPRTAEGLERSRRANWKHGRYSEETKRARAAAVERSLARLRAEIVPWAVAEGFVVTPVRRRGFHGFRCQRATPPWELLAAFFEKKPVSGRWKR